MAQRRYIFIVQVARQLCVDILNEFAMHDSAVELYTGEISNTYNPLNEKVKVHYLCKYKKGSSLKRFLTWTWFTKQVFFLLLFRKKRNSELVFISTPPFTSFIGLLFKKLFNQNYHLAIWDLYPEALLSVNIKQKHFIYKLWERLNHPLFRNAKSVITVGDHMAKAINKYYNKLPIVIPNWIDSKYIHPIKKLDNWFAKKYNQQDKFTILYSGNMGATHDLESIIKAAARLKDNKDINFLLIGDGSQKQYMERMVKEQGLHNVLLMPFQDIEVFPYSLSTGDLCIVTLDKEMGIVSVPSKTYSILAVGSAILAIGDRESELGAIIEKYHCGRIFKNGEVDKITEYILTLYKDRDLLNKYKDNARKVSNDFTPANAKKYYSCIVA